MSWNESKPQPIPGEPSVSNEEWHAIAAVAVDTMKSMERLHAKHLEVAERMAQALEMYRHAFDDEARAVLAEWEALK